MKVKNKINGGVVTVSEDYGKRLLASGDFVSAEEKKKRKPAPRKAKAEDNKED